MKKSLLAVAAMGAFAGAAQAQSSVTVYGLLDYGFGGASQTAAGPQALYQGNASGLGAVAAATTASGVIKTQTSGLGGNGESTSRIGFRGTEDLGGGTSGFFTIEAALTTDSNGAGFFSVSTNNAGSGNRQTFLGLAQKGLGQASIGIQYTPVHEAAAVTDAGGLNNQNGNVIYDRTGGFGSGAGQVTAGNGMTNQNASGMATNSSYTVRAANMLVLKTERMSGFMGKAFVMAGGKDSGSNIAGSTATAAGTLISNSTVNNFGIGGSVDYQWNKLFVTASYQSFNNQTTVDANTRTFTPGYNVAVINNGVNTQDMQQYYAATYDFGILKGYLQYVNRKIQNVNNNSAYIQRSAQQIGVRAPVGKQVAVWASAGTGRMNNAGSGAATANFNGWQLGTDYSLSKRTNLYAIYGQTATSNAVTASYGNSGNTSVSAVSPTSYNASSYAVGVRHTF